jgi:hypothetical protein
MQTTTMGFPPVFCAERSFACSSFRYIVLLFAPHPEFAIVSNMSIELDNLGDRIAKSQPDSPAVPERADATSVLGSSTPPLGSHTPPPTQVVGSEDQASTKEANEDVNWHRNTDRPIIEALEECIPKGSTSVLERMVHGRPKRATARLKCGGDSMMPDPWTPAAVWDHIGKMKPTERVVLVIGDIDDEWCEALCTKYPHAIDRKFFLEHVLGIENERRTQGIHDGLSPELHREFSKVVDLGPLDCMFPCLMSAREESFGQHIDCWLEPEFPESRAYVYEGCRLRLDPSGWTKINRLMSCCQLEENFCKSICLLPNSCRPNSG